MKNIFIAIINFYQKCISPLFKPHCRFFPTCSAYAKLSFERFGFFKGIYLSVRRILRCNPFSLGGIDYVPQKFHFKMKGNNHEK